MKNRLAEWLGGFFVINFEDGCYNLLNTAPCKNNISYSFT